MHRNTTPLGALGWTRRSLNSRRVIATLGVVLSVLLGVLVTGPSPASATGDSYSVVASVTVGSSPLRVSVSPDGSRVYVANHVDGSVSVIDTASNTVVATVTVGSYPSGVSVSPDGSRVYVADFGDGSVSVINTSNNTVVDTVAVGGWASDISVSPDGSRVYVVNYRDGSVSVINTSNNTVVDTVAVGSSPQGVSVSPDGSRVYVANYGDGSVSVINTSNNTVVDTVTVGVRPSGVSVSPDGSRVYVTNGMNSLKVIDTSSNTVVDTVTVASSGSNPSVSPDGSRVYVAGGGFVGSVSVIDTSSNTVVATVAIGGYTSGISVSPDGSRVYVAHGRLFLAVSPGSVEVISARASVTTPSAPTSLAAMQGNGSASIAFTAGAGGGAAISKYQYKIGNGTWTDAAGTTSPITVNGLINGTTHKIRLRAVNSAGVGVASSPVSVTPRLAGPAVTAATPSGRTGIVVTFNLNPLPGTTVAYQSVAAYAQGTNTVRGTCRTYGRQSTCFIGGLTRATTYDLRVTAHLPVPGKTWHNATAAGSILQVSTNN